MESGKSWIQKTFYKRECVKFLPASRNHHRCFPVCHVCQNLVRCCCGRLIGEHSELDSNSWLPPSGEEEVWCVVQHTKTSPTDAFGSIDFQGSNKCPCRAKYVRLSCDAKPEDLRCLMLQEWNMAQPKLLISVHGGTDNFPLPPRVGQVFSKGLIRAAETAGAWIFTDGFNTGVSMYVGDAVKVYGTHERRKRSVIGITPWGLIENHTDLMGRDVLRYYQSLGNPLSKRSSLNGLHSQFLLVDDGTLGKPGGQQELRRKLERHIQRQRIHPRLGQKVPLVCVVVEGGPPVLSTVLEYVSRSPPVPVIVFEGTGRAADLLSLIHKQTSADRELDMNIKEDFLQRIENVFDIPRAKAHQLFTLLKHCMKHREAITIFDSESEDHLEADVAILTASLRGTPADKLNVTLAWDRADIAQQHVLMYGHHWKVGALEHAMLNALLMDRVSFVKLLIENGVTMKHFLTVSRLEDLYNMRHQDSTDHFLRHIIEDAKQCRLPRRYKISLIDIGMVIEYLIGGAYRSTYRSKSFKAVYNRIHTELKEGSQDCSVSRKTRTKTSETNLPQPQFYRTADPYRRKMKSESLPKNIEAVEEKLNGSSLFVYTFNDLFVWAVLKRRQQLALFLWQHGVQAMARAVVACRLYQAMASEAKESNMNDSIADELRKYSLEFGQLAVDLLDKAFKENERMAMKLLTWEMTDWSNFTCLQMAVASGHRPFVAHSCTQMLLTDLWMGRLNMRKNSWLKIIVGILLPVGIQLLEFKSEAEMSHVPQSQEALQFGRDPGSLEEPDSKDVMQADDSDAERGRSHVKHRPSLIAWWLPCSRRVYDFYNAPVVKFWVHTISYLTFLALFSYTVLVRMATRPSVPEWLVIAYISSTAVDKIREVCVSEPRQFSKKLKMWFSEYWNMNEFVAIIFFFTGMALRWYTGLPHTIGRIIYCLDIILWFVRLLDLLAINQQAGPYLTMISNMMKNMFYIVVIMGIVLVSFGTPRWAILNPQEEPSWNLLKQVLFQPYFMMFGEVYAGEINPCEEDPDCPTGSFLNPLLQAVYLFMQYIIMVNLLIAFYNNVYVHMKTISNQLWRYNRYRYIMTYHKKPFLPPPLIFLSHMALCVDAVWQKCRRRSTHDRGSGLKLFLAPDDLKKLLEFEERCVAGYFRDKHESQHGSQINRIRLAADKAEEMMGTLAEVSEKVQFIQESLQTLDAHLGQLQDLSALAVDTLNLLSASENRQQEAVHLCPSPRITVMSNSLQSSVGNITPSHIPSSPKVYWSNPPSLPRVLAHSKLCQPFELPPGGTSSFFDSKLKWVLGNLEAEHSGPRPRLVGDSSIGFRLSHGSLSNLWPDQHGSPGQSCTSSLTTVWDHEPHNPPSQEESMEKEEDEDDDVFIDTRSTKNSMQGIVNPAFCGESELAMPRPNQFGRKWPFAIERDLGQSRSLSASVETLATPTKRHSVSGEPMSVHPGQKNRDLYKILERKRSFGRKCVKIKEGEAADVRRLERDLSRRSRRKGKGMAGRKFRSSVSLSQLNFDHVDFSQKSFTLGQNTRSPSQSVWNSWARSASRRSSVQSWAAVESRASVFKSTEDLDPHYSAMERNNLMRLAHTIPFTPVSLLGGEEVYIYTLVESEPDSMLSSTSWWCQRGHAAVLQPVSEQGVLDGGLRSAQWVLCTWAEDDVLKPGCVYVVKSFCEEVLHRWQAEFPKSTSLHLCLREIQQQRAAQKLMQVFNRVKPSSVPQSLRFLDLSLVFWQAKGQWLTIERSMNGNFTKYNNNRGEEITPSCGLEETVLSFSHWTYEYAGRELLVLDLQGVGVELTEPSVIRVLDKSSSRDLEFGTTNMGDNADRSFILNHTCNSCCRNLGLKDLRKSSNLHSPASEEGTD